MRKFIWITCVLALCYPLTATSESQEKLDTLRDRIQLLQKNLAGREKEKRYAADNLQKTERAISNINRKINVLLNEKRQANDQYEQLNQQQQRLRKIINTEQNQFDQLIYQQYVNNKQDHLKRLLNQNNPNQIMRDIHYYKYLSIERQNTINMLLNNQKELENLTQETHQKKSEINAIQKAYLTQKDQLTQQHLKHHAIVTKISKQVNEQQNEIEKLQRDEKRITNIVAEINKFLSQQKPSSSLYNNKLPEESSNKLPFSSLKGQLHLPVRGKLISRFGSQRSGKHITWKGLFISAPTGSTVKAIANGTVVFSDWLRGFGNLIIIDHGNRYMSLYGNNEALYKEVGDTIHSGDNIASVGNSGGNPISGLYFELRYKGQPFDPLTWTTIKQLN